MIVIHVFYHFHLIQRTFYNPLCSHTPVLCNQILFQRTAVYAYTDGNPARLCSIYHSLHAFPASDISGIDTDLIRSVFYGCHCKTIIKMDICHQGNMDLLFYLFQGLCRLHRWHSHPDDLASGLLQFKDLSHCSRHILCFCIAHGLDQYLLRSPGLRS